MADGMMSPAEAQLLANDGGNMWGGGGAFFWIFALLILAFGGGSRGDYVTNAELTNQLNAQSTQNQLQGLAVETANNNYETALLINNQTNQMLQQNNTNLINAIQGFNTVNQNMQSGFNDLGQRLDQIGYQMDQCCCSIKTMMLDNRLADKTAEAVALQNKLDNRDQTQSILAALGRFVAWTPSGTQAASAAG